MALASGQFTAAALALEIDGKHAGLVDSLAGGGVFAEVLEAPGAGGPADKSIGKAQYQDIVVTCGLPEDTLAGWVSGFLAGKAPVHDGAVILLDLHRQPVRRLEWHQGSIHAVSFPGLDAGGAKGVARLTLTIRPTVTRTVGGGGQVPAASKSQRKAWSVGNFTLSMPGIDCTRVVRIEPLVVTQTYQPAGAGRSGATAGPVHVDDLVVTVSEAGAADFLRWGEDFIVGGRNTASDELDATIRYLAPNLRDDVATLTVVRTGIFRVDPDSQVSGVARTSRVTASMYAEEVRFVGATAPVAPPAEPAARAFATPQRNLREVLGQRLAPADVAARLREQPSVDHGGDRVSTPRRLGRELGIAWAQRLATPTELREVASADDRDWSALSLPEGHSLAGTIAASVDIPLLPDGSLELPRDALSEGVLSGVLEALAELNEQFDV
jgi:hypothetical protein